MVKFGTDISSHQTNYQNIIKDNSFVIVKVTQVPDTTEQPK